MTDATHTPAQESTEQTTVDKTRNLQGPWLWCFTAVALLLAISHIFVAIWPVVSEIERNTFHFAGFVILAALSYPMFRSQTQNQSLQIIDFLAGLIVALAAIYMVFQETAINERGIRLNTMDWVAGVICIIGAIEFTRRVAGWVIPILIVLSITYIGYWGAKVSGIFQFPGLKWDSILFRSIYGDDALFGTIASISSTYVFLFIIFGAFLVRSGAGDFVVNLARAIAGRLIGGPGMVAVISSGLTGTINGSAIANTASTGVITIPLMKRAGFRPTFAAGVEAASSTGGQLMPPIMGAGAFAMASLTEISYDYIIAIAALPALLYFLSVIFFVRIEAKRLNIPPMPAEGETLLSAVRKNGASFIIPIVLLIFMLASGYSPTYAAVFGILSVVASSWVTQNRMGPRAIIEALIMGSRNMIMTAVLLCAVGLVVNVIATAGIGNTFSLMINDWANGNLMIAIVLVALASLILGMGLPVTAAYIILATLSAPALAGMIADREIIGLIAAGNLPQQAQAIAMISVPDAMTLLSEPMPRTEAAALVQSLPLSVISQIRNAALSQELIMAGLLSAHMIVFWLSQDSNVTPPVALAAFTAATIAKSPPMKTGVESWKLAKGLYIMPVLFAYTGLLSGDWTAMVTVFLLAIVGIYGLAGMLQGCLEYKLTWPMRILVGAFSVAALWPGALWLNLTGVIGVLGCLGINVASKPSKRSTPSSV